MPRSCEIVDSRPQPALAVCEVVAIADLPTRIGHGFGAVMQHLGRLGESPAGGPFVGYLSMGPSFDAVIGFPTTRELPGAGDVGPTTIPGGRRAVTMHTGPYEQLAVTYEELMAWVAGQGEKPAGPVYEFYLNSPDEVPVGELLTRIELLLD